MSAFQTGKVQGFGRCGAAVMLLLLSTSGAVVAQPVGLARAHAHNDYEHERPLLDALDHGFNSVEADIYLVDGELLVAHDRADVQPGRTLEQLYLAPLRAYVRQRGGRAHAGLPPLLLLIDIKSGAEETYTALDAVLGRYADILTRFAGDAVVEGAVTAVISGNRPRELMQAAAVRYAAFDGRLSDLNGEAAGLSPGFMPLVSDHWLRITLWRGKGPAPEAARTALAEAVAKAHAQGRRLRLWGTPDNPAVWQFLYDAGVDLINTDDLGGLRDFLLERQ